MHAAAIGSLEAVRLLLERGANVNAADSSGVTPLMFAARDAAKGPSPPGQGCGPRREIEAGPDRATNRRRHAAVHRTFVRALVEKGADPKAIGAGGRTGLTIAAWPGNWRRFSSSSLMVWMPTPHRSDKEGNTPLRVARRSSMRRWPHLLLKKGADVNAATRNPGVTKNGPAGMGGLTALRMAVPYGSPSSCARSRCSRESRCTRQPRDDAVDAGSRIREPGSRGRQMLLTLDQTRPPRAEAGETALDWAGKSANPRTLTLFEGATRPPPPHRSHRQAGDGLGCRAALDDSGKHRSVAAKQQTVQRSGRMSRLPSPVPSPRWPSQRYVLAAFPSMRRWRLNCQSRSQPTFGRFRTITFCDWMAAACRHDAVHDGRAPRSHVSSR